jgi:hypothetical protein
MVLSAATDVALQRGFRVCRDHSSMLMHHHNYIVHSESAHPLHVIQLAGLAKSKVNMYKSCPETAALGRGLAIDPKFTPKARMRSILQVGIVQRTGLVKIPIYIYKQCSGGALVIRVASMSHNRH